MLHTFYPTKMILKYCDMFLKLKDLCDSPTFKEVDMNNDGSVFPKDFKAQLEKSKKYTKYADAQCKEWLLLDLYFCF